MLLKGRKPQLRDRRVILQSWLGRSFALGARKAVYRGRNESLITGIKAAMALSTE